MIKGLPYKFTVINASNEDRPTEVYLERLEMVLNYPREQEVINVITISLIFKQDNHYVKPVLDYLNTLSDTFDVHYIILNNGWKNGTLDKDSISQLKAIVNDDDRIHEFKNEINFSKTAFNDRTEEILETIKKFNI